MVVRLLPLVFVVLFLGGTPQASAQFVSAEQIIYAGDSLAVQLPVDADALVVSYRPNSAIEHVVRVPARGGVASWTPTQAGIVELSVPSGPRQTLSVQFRAVPISGLAVLIIAGLILFGGASLTARRLFREDDTALVQ